MEPRTRRYLAIVVALALVGVIAYSGALSMPYIGAGERFAVAHESTEAYESAVSGELSPLPVVSLSDLSAGERRAYEAAKDQPVEPGTSGEQVLSSIQVCNDVLVVCDGYREIPHPADTDWSIVDEPDGERYLVRVGTGGDLIRLSMLPFIFVWKVAVFGPYALFLAYRSMPSRSGRVTNTAIGYGAFMIAVALLAPYVWMYTGVQLFLLPFVMFTIETPLLLAFEVWREWRWPNLRAIANRGLAIAIVLLSPFVLLYAAGALDWALNNFF